MKAKPVQTAHQPLQAAVREASACLLGASEILTGLGALLAIAQDASRSADGALKLRLAELLMLGKYVADTWANETDLARAFLDESSGQEISVRGRKA